MAAPESNGDGLSQIVLALEATYDPRSSNETRQSALQFLESAKKQADAPQHGFALASDQNQQPAVRHYGLSLLEYALRYRWEDYSQEQAGTLRGWILNLARDISESDPLYFRNKVALLWIEVAKRCWAAEWEDMDELLVSLWETSDVSKQSVYRQLVLYILECLSEDVCNREDPIAGLRQDVLGQALNEIVIPQALYQDHLSTRGNSQNVRFTQDGWLARISAFVSACCSSIAQGDQRMLALAIKSLEALKPTTVWVSLRALAEANTIDCLYAIIFTGSVPAQTASIEVLQSILQRPYNPHFHDTWATIMRLTLRCDRVALLSTLYQSCQTTSDDIDEAKYTLQKKMTEVLSILGDAVAQNPSIVEDAGSLSELFDLLAAAFQSESLIVSIPALHSFTKLLVTKNADLSNAMAQRLALLLGVCSQRLIRYESFFQESDMPVIAYLNEDFETLPELHAFLGNYRRYCITIIEGIACAMPQEAVTYILEQTVELVGSISREFVPPFQNTLNSKTPLPVLQLEAQASVLRSTLNGFGQWLSKLAGQDAGGPAAKEAYRAISSTLRDFCYKIMSAQSQHPDVSRLAMHMVVNTLCKTLYKGQPELVVKVLDYAMGLRLPEIAAQKDYMDALKNFEGARLGELHRIALSFSDYLLDVFSDLEARVESMIQANPKDDRMKWGLQAFLLIIIHRASAVDQEARISRLQPIVQPVIEAWQNPELTEALSTFSGFCQVVGLGGLPEYLSSRNYASSQDWPCSPLDDEGKARQEDIHSRTLRLPLNPTKNLLGATTEKLKDGSREYQIGAQIWGSAMQAILPNLLQLARHATAFPEPSNWSSLPNELQVVMQRMLVDRFWQSGISNESRDEFYARISETGSTYEGFGSTVRGVPRSIRDWCYHIIYGMTRFEEQFYSIQDLPVPLAEALLVNATALSAHHLQRLISLIERLVQRCPPHHRQNFLPPILTLFFQQVDKKISAEWEDIEKTNLESGEDDNLGDEMKAESILRATTYAVVSFASTLLDQKTGEQRAAAQCSISTSQDLTNESHLDTALAEGAPQPSSTTSTTSPSSSAPTNSIRYLVLSTPTILEPLILFCTHTLRTHDSRCCTIITRVLRSMIPVFNDTNTPSSSSAHGPQVREFICTEVLKACITSLNEPYFVDVQRDLATLIANIIHLYSDKTSTPRDVIASLPDMRPQKVEEAVEKIRGVGSERQQRALVLALLEGVRGVSIHEAGRIVGGSKQQQQKARAGAQQGKRSAMQQSFMEVEQKPSGAGGIGRGDSPGLEGMADMFGDA